MQIAHLASFIQQLFQLTLSDQNVKPMRQDRMVVWVEVEPAAHAACDKY